MLLAPPAAIVPIGPCATTRPRSTIATASQIFSTSSSRCDESRIVRPSSPFVESSGPSIAMSAGAAAFVVALWALVALIVGAWRTATRDA